MTKVESKQAQEFLKTLTLKVLLKARQTLQQAFENQNASRATRNTYGSRFNQFLLWGEQQPWWPNSSKKERVQNQCCFLLKNPHGAISKTPLTERRTAYLSYMLQPQETPSGLG
jgi:spermidine synthase